MLGSGVGPCPGWCGGWSSVNALVKSLMESGFETRSESRIRLRVDTGRISVIMKSTGVSSSAIPLYLAALIFCLVSTRL